MDGAVKLAYALPWLLLVVAVPLTALRVRSNPADLRNQRDLLVTLLALAFLAAFNRPHDWVHLLVLYPPTLLLGAALVSRLPPRRAFVAAGAVTLGTALLVSGLLALQFQERHGTAVVTPRGVFYTTSPQAAVLQGMVDLLSTSATARPLAALPYEPLLNFLSGRPGVTRFYLVWPVERDKGRDDEIIARLEASPEATIVYSPEQFPQFPLFSSYAPTLVQYLAEHYRVARRIGSGPEAYQFVVLERTTGPHERPVFE